MASFDSVKYQFVDGSVDVCVGVGLSLITQYSLIVLPRLLRRVIAQQSFGVGQFKVLVFPAVCFSSLNKSGSAVSVRGCRFTSVVLE